MKEIVHTRKVGLPVKKVSGETTITAGRDDPRSMEGGFDTLTFEVKNCCRGTADKRREKITQHLGPKDPSAWEKKKGGKIL